MHTRIHLCIVYIFNVSNFSTLYMRSHKNIRVFSWKLSQLIDILQKLNQAWNTKIAKTYRSNIFQINSLAIKSKNLQVQYVEVGVNYGFNRHNSIDIDDISEKNIGPTMVDAILNFSTKNPVLGLAPRTKTWPTINLFAARRDLYSKMADSK